jgi:hypothetical protein
MENNLESLKNHIRALNSLNKLAKMVDKKIRNFENTKKKKSKNFKNENTNIQNPDANKKLYDSIIFIRPDVKLISEIPVRLLGLYSDVLFVPDFHRFCGGERKCICLYIFISIFI